MSEHLDWRQKNTLLAGGRLAAEIPASCEHCRAFLIVWAYDNDNPRKRLSRFINKDEQELAFSIARYEFAEGFEAYPFDADKYQHSYSVMSDIPSFTLLESKLVKQMGDLSQLMAIWKTDFPL